MPAGPHRLPGRQGLAKKSIVWAALRTAVVAARLRHRAYAQITGCRAAYPAAIAACRQPAGWSAPRALLPRLVAREKTFHQGLPRPGTRRFAPGAGSLPGKKSSQTVSAQAFFSDRFLRFPSLPEHSRSGQGDTLVFIHSTATHPHGTDNSACLVGQEHATRKNDQPVVTGFDAVERLPRLGGRSHSRRELPFRRADGSTLWVDLDVVPVHDRDGAHFAFGV